MTEPEIVPTVGSRIGRYLMIREVAQGPLGPLFIAEREVGEGVSYGLARVVSLPSELPAHDEQVLADAIWDSTQVKHELVLHVADVITGKGSITLIHEHSEGSLLAYLHTCVMQLRGSFPAKVASRLALDIIEGLEQSRDLCASAGIPWRAGSVSPGSLLLGPDGRVRAMDGQITAAALRVPALRQSSGVASYAAPELLDDTREPTERSDVFAVGVLLWELLTGQSLFSVERSSTALGHGFKVPKVVQTVPPGTKVPQGLVHTVHTALEAEPGKRQQSLRELAVAIVMGVEDVSTHEQVLEFTDGLLLSTSSDAPAAAPAPEPAGVSEASPASASSEPSAQPSAPAEPTIFTVETPGVSDSGASAIEASMAGDSGASAIEASVAGDSGVSAVEASGAGDSRASAIETSGAGDSGVSAVEAPVPDDTKVQAVAPAVEQSAAAERASDAPRSAADDSQDEVTGERSAVEAPERAVAETDSSRYRAHLGTLPGHGDAADASPRSSVPPPSAGPFRLVHDEPFVPIAIKPVQVVGDTERKSTPPSSVSSNPPSASVSPSNPVPAVAPGSFSPSAAPGHTVQLSMGTIVFGILTTVLAVVVVMMIIMRPSGGSADAPVLSAKAAVPAERAEPTAPVVAKESIASNPEVTTVVASDAGLAGVASARGDHHKHNQGPASKDKAGKSASAEGDTRSTDSKPEQPTNRHFIPNEL